MFQIKYTAYNGWISSGLVTWNIDKVAILDSFGKSTSICRRSLSLESGKSVYLKLYPGECNIPTETDNVTTASGPVVEQFAQERQGGIGPFTRDQNVEKKETSSVDLISNERFTSKKGLGPFTKDQNPKPPVSEIKDTSKPSYSDSKTVVETPKGPKNNKVKSC